jgi:hypothetical protein
MFVARHLGGPMGGRDGDMSITAPRTPERLFYAPVPPGVRAPSSKGYMLVGYDQPPERAWAGQVEYQLDRDASELAPHPEYDEMQTGVAVYVIVE